MWPFFFLETVTGPNRGHTEFRCNPSRHLQENPGPPGQRLPDRVFLGVCVLEKSTEHPKSKNTYVRIFVQPTKPSCTVFSTESDFAVFYCSVVKLLCIVTLLKI